MAENEGADPVAPLEPDADWVFTTVVDGAESDAFDGNPSPMNLGDSPDDVSDVPQSPPQSLPQAMEEPATSPVEPPGNAPELAELEARLAPLEALPSGLETLGRVTRQELERCAGVLFGHDRALKDARDRSDVLAGRLDAIEADDTPGPGIVEQLERVEQRLVAMEAQVEPLEAVPTIVQALRRAVRASDDVLAGEVTAREAQVAALASELAAEAQARDEALRRLLAQDLDRMAGIAGIQAQTLAEASGRLDAAEARLAPLDSAPADIEALSRILRRELDAIVTDNQARDQMLRRALQQEIDQLRAESGARADAAVELAARLDAAEAGLAQATEALADLQRGVAVAGSLAAQVQTLREMVRAELDQVQAGSKAHDQVMGEITRTFSALDGRLARLDPVPGELQSLRTALRQEGERSVTQLRVVEERLSQLSWVPGEFQEARKRILTLTSGLQLEQDSLKSLEAALAATNERVRALGTQLGAAAPPRSPA